MMNLTKAACAILTVICCATTANAAPITTEGIRFDFEDFSGSAPSYTSNGVTFTACRSNSNCNFSGGSVVSATTPGPSGTKGLTAITDDGEFSAILASISMPFTNDLYFIDVDIGVDSDNSAAIRTGFRLNGGGSSTNRTNFNVIPGVMATLSTVVNTRVGRTYDLRFSASDGLPLPFDSNGRPIHSFTDGRIYIDNLWIRQVPLPAALPLLAAALGVFGFMGWQRSSPGRLQS